MIDVYDKSLHVFLFFPKPQGYPPTHNIRISVADV